MAARLPPDPETQSYLSSQESMSCEGSVEDAFDDEPSSIILTGTAPVLQSPSEDTPEQRSHQSVRRKVSPEKIGRMRVKRSLTIVACVLCRRKHGKCDGVRPTCSACQLLGGPVCVYDALPSDRRSTALKAELKICRQELATFRSAFDAIQSAAPENSQEIFERLRRSADVTALVQELGAEDTSEAGRGVGLGTSTDLNLFACDVKQQNELFNESMTTIEGAVDEEAKEVLRRLRSKLSISSIIQLNRAGWPIPELPEATFDSETTASIADRSSPTGGTNLPQPRKSNINFLLNPDQQVMLRPQA
ncbi:hypothetical protein MMC24_000362 [Lignoscripta atroalba]|nr:hypothetical protein [Lignoscripta atroalba]